MKSSDKTGEKTNVMRVLDQKKIPYRSHAYTADPSLSGEEIAALLGEDADRVFKTLVTVGKTGKNYVFVIPVREELDLKKAAAAAGEKNIVMIRQKELLPLTGYVHGGCSPKGMKKQYQAFVHEAATELDRMPTTALKPASKTLVAMPIQLVRMI